jgi:hypothetical protein
LELIFGAGTRIRTRTGNQIPGSILLQTITGNTHNLFFRTGTRRFLSHADDHCLPTDYAFLSVHASAMRLLCTFFLSCVIHLLVPSKLLSCAFIVYTFILLLSIQQNTEELIRIPLPGATLCLSWRSRTENRRVKCGDRNCTSRNQRHPGIQSWQSGREETVDL